MDGDENWHLCAFGIGAPVSIGQGWPAPAAPHWIRPCYLGSDVCNLQTGILRVARLGDERRLGGRVAKLNFCI